jgi:hypothetical protein
MIDSHISQQQKAAEEEESKEIKPRHHKSSKYIFGNHPKPVQEGMQK